MADPTITYYEDQEMVEKCGHNFKMITGVLTFTTYTTDGVGFDLRGQLPVMVHYVGFDQKNGHKLVYDYTNRKIIIYKSVGAQTTSSQDLSSVLADTRFIAIGK